MFFIVWKAMAVTTFQSIFKQPIVDWVNTGGLFETVPYSGLH